MVGPTLPECMKRRLTPKVQHIMAATVHGAILILSFLCMISVSLTRGVSKAGCLSKQIITIPKFLLATLLASVFVFFCRKFRHACNSVVSSGGQPPLSSSSTSLHVNHRKVGAGLPSQNNTSSRELNLVLFGLQETSSIVETKDYVDEILDFIAGRPISIKDLFRLGRLARPSSPSASISRRPRLLSY